MATVTINEILISKIKIGKRFRHEIGDVTPLCISIQKLGLLHPIVINEDDELIAGMRRIEAYKQMHKGAIPFTRINLKQTLLGEFDENTQRKEFLPSEIYAITEAIERTRIGHRPKKGEMKTPFPKGKTREVVAKITGSGPDKIQKIKYVMDHGTKKDREKMDKNNNVESVFRNVKMVETQKNLVPITIPTGQINVLVEDPSWPYENKISGGSLSSGNAQQYLIQSMQQIINAIPKEQIADDAIYFLWTLPTFHEEALAVVKARGFDKIRTKLYLIKDKIKQGYNYRNQVEECLVCIKGKVRAFHMTTQSNAVFAKTNGHSVKPDIFFKIFEESARRGLAGKRQHRMELNSRVMRPGWKCIGNQFGCKKCNGWHVEEQKDTSLCKCKCHPKKRKKC
jgi:ParB family transcriptional regulator, chromosome partitioning protein